MDAILEQLTGQDDDLLDLAINVCDFFSRDYDEPDDYDSPPPLMTA